MFPLICISNYKCQLLSSIIRNRVLLLHTTTNCFNQVQKETQKEQENKKSNTPPGLMEFFDDPKNWGVHKIVTGRSWKKEELRLKSNEDLHKLWYSFRFFYQFDKLTKYSLIFILGLYYSKNIICC